MYRTIKECKNAMLQMPSCLKSVPFWGWNERIDCDEAERQLTEMHKQGIGGVFIHSREGLETPYLSDEWMRAVERVVQAAERLNMEVWIYDEDKWPSGSAGGAVAALCPEYAAKALTFARQPVGANGEEDDIIGRYVCGDGSEMILRVEISGTSEWYNGSAPTDMLNPEAVDAFISLTHEKYRSRFEKYFGGVIKGFFTDEPNCFDFFANYTPGRPFVSWTTGFAEYFAEKRGYSPIPYLPYLFTDDFVAEAEKGIDAPKLRHDYWRTITERFSEAYMQKIAKWCEDNRLYSTGHMLYENDLGYQARVCGAVMPQYRYLHAPGIDILGAQTKEYLTVKQCASVAHQLGRETVFSEIYGCTGWELSYADQITVADWQFAMGVTRRCQHLALYSITGCRKRDYPPVFQYQNPWWKYDHYLESYYGRLTAALSTGEVVRRLLVVHPMSSIWCACRSDEKEDLNNIEMNMGWKDEEFVSLNREGEELNRLSEMLMGLHVDFDFGDETILSESAYVKNGRLQVGRAEYDAVLVPPVTTLFKSTYRILSDYSKSGGALLWMLPVPARMDGALSDDAQTYLEAIATGRGFSFVSGYGALPEKLLSMGALTCPLRIIGRDCLNDASVIAMLREADDGHVLFLHNRDTQHAHEVQPLLEVGRGVERLELMNGESESVPAQRDKDGALRFVYRLSAGQSALFFISKQTSLSETNVGFSYIHPHASERVYASMSPRIKAVRGSQNLLPLDVCRFALNGGALSEAMPVWQAQRRMREELNMRQIYYNGAPQRYTWLTEESRQAEFRMRFEFCVDIAPTEPTYAVVEKPQGLDLTLNGAACAKTKDWMFDRGMVCFALPKLHKGTQCLEICGQYTSDRELEDVFVAGAFGVDNSRRITAEPEYLRLGDWGLQGYPHYAGNMTIDMELPELSDMDEERIELRAGAFSAACILVRVNGRDAGMILHKNDRIDVTRFLQNTGNTLTLETVGSLRNVLGPLHRVFDGCSRISWADFRTEHDDYTPEYTLVPYGIMEPMILVFVK